MSTVPDTGSPQNESPVKSSPLLADAVLRNESGWLCLRNESGWLLWSQEISYRPNFEIRIADIIEEAERTQASWLKDSPTDDDESANQAQGNPCKDR